MPAVVDACGTLTASISLHVPSAEGSGKGYEANQGDGLKFFPQST